MSEAPLWLFALLAGLLLTSGFFSASETALFSLTRLQRMQSSATVRSLLERPRALLLSILLCNLVVNLLFFLFSTRLSGGEGATDDLALALGALLALLVFSEILPKTIGLRARTRVARLAAPALRSVVAVVGPVGTPLLRLLDATHRVLSLWLPEEQRVTPEVLASVMERSAEEGHLLDTEADLLAEVLELDQIRVREIMTPRVDALFLDLSDDDRREVIREALRNRQPWLPVMDKHPDRVVGRVRLRDLIQHADRPTSQLVMPVKFVPEVASALDLLRSLRADRTSEAIVVDEWGGTAGFVTAEDVFEEIVGELRTEDEERAPPVVPLGEGRYRVAGSLSIRDWNERFGMAVVPTEYETVGGFITALLGRIPRAGDSARVGGLVLEVHEVRGRRVHTVDIGLQEFAAAGVAPGGAE